MAEGILRAIVAKCDQKLDIRKRQVDYLSGTKVKDVIYLVNYQETCLRTSQEDPFAPEHDLCKGQPFC